MLMGDTFEVGSVKRKVMKCEVDELINEISKGEKSLPSEESIANFMQKSSADSKEIAEIYDILKELHTDKGKTETFYNNNPTTSERKIAFRKKVLVVFKVIVKVTHSVVIFCFQWYCIDYKRVDLNSWRLCYIGCQYENVKDLKSLLIFQLFTWNRFIQMWSDALIRELLWLFHVLLKK